MRFLPVLALAAVLLPVLAAAKTDEWVRDDMSDESLWLLRTANLAREAPRGATLPGAPDGSSHWVMSKGDGPAYVVYFIPGQIHEVEIDTHRLADATGDFTLAVSTDGKLYQPLDAGAVLLDTSFGWDYRLMGSDQIPKDATHLLVQFPEGSTAHSLSEVWIRYTWDDALASRFLPPPVVALPAENETAMQSDFELERLLEQLMPQQLPDPTPQAERQVEIAQVSAPSVSGAGPVSVPAAMDLSAATVQPVPALVLEVPKQDAVEEVPPEIVADTPAPSEGTDSKELDEPVELAAGSLETVPPAPATPGTEPTGSSVTDPEGAPPNVVELPPEEAQSESGAPIGIAEELKPPESDNTPVRSEDSKESTPPVAEAPPADIAALDTPTVAAATVDEPPAAVPEAKNPEDVSVLPTFTIAAMAAPDESETLAPTQLEPAPPAQDLAVVPTPAEPVAERVFAPESIGADNSEQPAISLPKSAAIVPDTPPPAPIQDSNPVLIAAALEPASRGAAPAELSEDDEPRHKPAMKLKRTGPRSKSRGSYVARG